MRHEIEALLASADGDTGNQLEHVVQRAAGSMVESQDSGIQIGPYRVLRQLAQGGMGAVYLAERSGEFEQRVALKVVRAGVGDRAAMLARFRAERQMLANLNHPNIARLLDGGETGAGEPYLAMEYVDGVPLDAYVRDHALPVRDRVKLMMLVCSAVQCAHQNLIIHRDLKPTNVLVTSDGTPKLLDFGIAKLLDTGEPGLTRQSERLLTPAYASPEQIQGGAVTTATDVYALGVLLYELLTGRPVFDASTLTPYELEVAVCTTQPAAPRSLVKIDSDLEAIVMKAIRKEPQHRYSSVMALEDDLQRYLDGFPVQALNGTWRYTAAKFIRRHRGALAAVALIAGTLLWGGISIYRAQQKAANRFGEVRELANHFLFEFEGAIEALPGATPARALVVRRGLQYLDRLADESQDDIDLQKELAAGYERLREVQYGFRLGHLGDTAGAAVSAKKATRLRERIVAARPKDASALDALGYALQTEGALAWATGNLTEAMPLLARGGCRRARGPTRPGESGLFVQSRHHLPVSWKDRAQTGQLQCRSRLAATRSEYRNPLAGCQTNAGTAPCAANVRVEIGDIYLNVTGEPAKALPIYREAERLEEERNRLEPNSAPSRRELNVTRQRIALAYINRGDRRAALPYLYRNLEQSTLSLKADPTSAFHQRGMSVAEVNIGDTLSFLGEHQAAIGYFQKAALIREERFARDPKGAETRADLMNLRCQYGIALDRKGDHAAALKELTGAVELGERIVAEDPARMENRMRLGRIYLAFEEHWAGAHDCAKAQTYYQKAHTLFEALAKQNKILGTDLQYPRKAEAAIAGCSATLKPIATAPTP